MKRVLIVLSFALSFSAGAHEGHHHGAQTQESKTASAEDGQRQAFATIETNYEAKVRPIFEEKCASCHSVQATSPWYASLPLLNGLIEGDRAEAKKHLEISKGFPFGGHGEPVEDLKAIEEATEKNSMPPGLFAFMHPSLKLNDADKKTILEWTHASESALSPFTKGNHQ